MINSQFDSDYCLAGAGVAGVLEVLVEEAVPLVVVDFLCFFTGAVLLLGAVVPLGVVELVAGA